MKLICDKKECTGCGLCATRCPKHCIEMKPGSLGHLYPEIDQSKCIDCKLCQKGCPSLQDISSCYPKKAYAAWSKDEEDYISSTSGGIASVLSQYIVAKGGVVYGCSVLPNIQISHIRVDKLENLHLLKGSKYVQSQIKDIIPQLRKDVLERNLVLFIGTPCQVAAIKQLYKTIPDNLFLVDIICHGTPSNKFLKDYIQRNLKIDVAKVTDVKFRLPNEYSLCVFEQDKLLYKSNNLWTHRYEDLYMDTFIDGCTFRYSCNSCHYAKSNRISDLTIGDFWGLGKEVSDKDIPEHKNGISCVLPITDKGMILLNAICFNINIYERPVTEAINGNDQLRHPKNKNWRISMFQKLHNLIGIKAAYHLMVADRMVKYKLRKILKQ